MNPFDQYGIKEVADGIFYELDTDGSFKTPVLYLDTLKITTFETGGNVTEAKGGKGAPKLIQWDHSKDINVTLQDALFSMKSLSYMHGTNVKVHDVAKRIRKAETVYLTAVSTTGTTPAITDSYSFTTKYTPVAGSTLFILENGASITGSAGTYTQAGLTATKTTDLVVGSAVRVIYEATSAADKTYEIVIKPDAFPGTYGFIGDTVIRNRANGADEAFQIYIPKLKISAETTLTLEAEGEPSVFDMKGTVLKSENGSMMSLVRYDLGSVSADAEVSNLEDVT